MQARESNTTVLLGYDSRNFDFIPIEELTDQADFEHRLPSVTQRWWLRYSRLLFQLAKYGYEDQSASAAATKGASWTNLPD